MNLRPCTALLMTLTLALCQPPATLSAQGTQGARGGTPVTLEIGSYAEDHLRPGDETWLRVPLMLTLSVGSPRSTRIEFEPSSAAWHTVNGVTDASGRGPTRLRAWHLFGANRRISAGPDYEMYAKTESQTSLGYGYWLLMPGFQVSYNAGRNWRLVYRTRFEYSAGEDAGVTSVSRVTLRPMVVFPPGQRLSSWLRTDATIDFHTHKLRNNIEGNVSLKVDPARRLALYAQPRLYVGGNARARQFWRLRAGFSWTLTSGSVGAATKAEDAR